MPGEFIDVIVDADMIRAAVFIRSAFLSGASVNSGIFCFQKFFDKTWL